MWVFVWMNLAEYSSCDGVALADLVRKREVSPKELARLFVEAVEKVNPRINAVIEVYSDRVEGLDDRVKISEVPDRLVATLRFSGRWTNSLFEKKTKELLDELRKARIKTRGNVFSMLYNAPFTPSFMRRNEVAVEVEP